MCLLRFSARSIFALSRSAIRGNLTTGRKQWRCHLYPMRPDNQPENVLCKARSTSRRGGPRSKRASSRRPVAAPASSPPRYVRRRRSRPLPVVRETFGEDALLRLTPGLARNFLWASLRRTFFSRCLNARLNRSKTVPSSRCPSLGPSSFRRMVQKTATPSAIRTSMSEHGLRCLSRRAETAGSPLIG
jgi:hypothetical protein